MADKSITKLEAVATPTSEDLAIIVTSAATEPQNKKSTLATLFNKIPTWLGLSTTPIVYTVGEIDVTTPVSFLSVTGSTTFSLPAGSVGQIKMLICTVAASTPVGVVTPEASANDGYDVINFTKVGQSATLIYSNSGWIILSVNTEFARTSRAGNADIIVNEDDSLDGFVTEDNSFRIEIEMASVRVQNPALLLEN